MTKNPGLGRTKQLEALWLSASQLTDVSALAKITQLKYLSLEGNEKIDLNTVAKLTQLGALSLEDNRISEAEIEKLQKALPKCKISHNAPRKTLEEVHESTRGFFEDK